jgi:hypothetical protein
VRRRFYLYLACSPSLRPSSSGALSVPNTAAPPRHAAPSPCGHGPSPSVGASHRPIPTAHPFLSDAAAGRARGAVRRARATAHRRPHLYPAPLYLFRRGIEPGADRRPRWPRRSEPQLQSDGTLLPLFRTFLSRTEVGVERRSMRWIGHLQRFAPIFLYGTVMAGRRR